MPLERISRELLRHQVRLHSLSRYFAGPETRNGLVFGLGAVEVPDIEWGVSLLRQAMGSGRAKSR